MNEKKLPIQPQQITTLKTIVILIIRPMIALVLCIAKNSDLDPRDVPEEDEEEPVFQIGRRSTNCSWADVLFESLLEVRSNACELCELEH